ncbi:MAG: hypothetical protein AAGC54_12975, partial [Cyanobacteria bacterium P01_F01_bin.4]
LVSGSGDAIQRVDDLTQSVTVASEQQETSSQAVPQSVTNPPESPDVFNNVSNNLPQAESTQPASIQRTLEPPEAEAESQLSESESRQHQPDSTAVPDVQKKLTEPPLADDSVVQRSVPPEESKTVQLGASVQLPTVLKPLGVLRSLPALELRSQPTPPSDLENAKVLRSESETIQRQATEGDIPAEWSNLESLVADLTGEGQGDANIQRQIAETDTGHETNSKTDDETDGETNSQTNGEIIQRQGADGDVPSEWSNLENLVTHLKGNTSNSESAKTSAPPSSPEAKTDIKPNDAKPNDIESSVQSSSAQSSSAQPARPAAMPVATIQRRVARPSPASKPVLIQACQDTPTATITSESDGEQTDGIRDYSRYLELLAQEVYSLLRQRLSLEQERRGPKYPR